MEDEKIIDLFFQRNEDALAVTSHKYGKFSGNVVLLPPLALPYCAAVHGSFTKIRFLPTPPHRSLFPP